MEPVRVARRDLRGLRVLVVDDEADLRLGLRRLLSGLGVEVLEAADGDQALGMLERRPCDLVLTDLRMPGMSGAELLAEVHRRWASTPVVVFTGYGTIETAVTCMRRGAAHFLTKPVDNDEIVALVERMGRQVLAGREGLEPNGAAPGIVAEDPNMTAVLELVARVAPSPATVLIEGESGTGKELIARALHAGSGASGQPFVAVNTGALPDTLLESELFGHRRGAFTGADRDRRGLFEEAGRGTVFLDEVSSMSPGFQSKLLRVLQEMVVRPLGGSRDVPVQFRLVAATNRDLGQMVREGEFREDLYYRLRVVSVRVPPLRERPADIPALAVHFLSRAARTCLDPTAAAPELSEEALAELCAHSWPGNVRELENTMQRAVVVCYGGRIQAHHLGLRTSSWGASPAPADGDYDTAKRQAIERFQREFVQRSLERCGGNVSQAAESCGMTRAALQRIMRQLDIDRRRFLRD